MAKLGYGAIFLNFGAKVFFSARLIIAVYASLRWLNLSGVYLSIQIIILVLY
jgi:hypothetical protein